MKTLEQLAREAGMVPTFIDLWHSPNTDGVTEEDLARFRTACRAEALEEAAQLCDTIEGGRYPDGQVCAGFACECAAAIREMK